MGKSLSELKRAMSQGDVKKFFISFFSFYELENYKIRICFFVNDCERSKCVNKLSRARNKMTLDHFSPSRAN